MEQTPAPQQPVNYLTAIYDMYPEDKYNYLYPSTTIIQVSPLQQIGFEIVNINPLPLPTGQDCYKIGKEKILTPQGEVEVEKLALTKTALEKLATGAGVQIDYTASGLFAMPNVRQIGYKIVGGFRLPSGENVVKPSTKVIDIDVLVSMARDKAETQRKKGEMIKEWKKGQNGKFQPIKYAPDDEAGKQAVNDFVRSEELRILQHVHAMAESKAYTRLIRSLLALKSWYTQEELRKPFIVIKVSTNVAFLLSDPATKQIAAQMALQSSFTMFGQGRQLAAPPTDTKQIPAQLQMSDIPTPAELDPEDTDLVGEPGGITPHEVVNEATGEMPITMKEPEQKKELADITGTTPFPEVMELFNVAPYGEKVECVKRFMQIKAYKPKKEEYNHPDKMDVESLTQYIEFLYQRETPGTPTKKTQEKLNFE